MIDISGRKGKCLESFWPLYEVVLFYLKGDSGDFFVRFEILGFVDEIVHTLHLGGRDVKKHRRAFGHFLTLEKRQR
jgi:hypothetical protein